MKKTLILTIFISLLLSTHTLLAEEIDPAYLSETKECQFTPELKALAKELEYNPVKIYNWVYENIEYESDSNFTSASSYTYSRKGAHCTYLTKRGNEWDQCSLLIALLRISGIPARYVQDKYEEDEKFALSHFIYVEAYISMNNYRGTGNDQEKIWVPLEPWRKHYGQAKNGIDLFISENTAVIPSELDFDFDEYLSSVKQKTVLELFEEKIQQYLNLHYPGKTLKDLPCQQQVIKKSSSILPTASFQPRNGIVYYAESPYMLTVQLTLKKSEGTILLEKKIYLPEIAGKRFCLDFIPASERDAQVISNYGGIHKTPVYAAELKPVLKLDGKIIQEGTMIKTGESFCPAINGEDRPAQPAGSFMVLAFDPFCASQETIQKVKEELNNIPTSVALNDLTREEYLGRVGQILITSYLYREYRAIRRSSELLHCQSSYGSLDISPTLMYISPEQIKKDGEAKFLVHPQWNIDAISGWPWTYKIGDLVTPPKPGEMKTIVWSLDHNSPLALLLVKLQMYDSSYNEGRIFEDWQDTLGACTVKGIMLAKEQGIPVVTLTKNDIVGGHLPILENETQDKLNAEVIQNIIRELNAGQAVTLPTRKIRYEDMVFSVYMTIGTDDFGMMFNYDHVGSYNTTVDLVPELTKQVIDTDKVDEFDSVDITHGGQSSKSVNEDNSNTALPSTIPPAQTSQIVNTANESNNPQTNDQEAVKATDGDPVDLVSGEFYHEENPDFEIKSRAGLKLDIVRNYKSQLIYNGPFGYGWAWNHSERLLIGTNGDLIFYNAERIPYYLTFKPDGTYAYPSGTTFVMRKEGDGYLLTEKDKRKIFFSETGLLTKKEDPNGNSLTFEYDSQDQLIRIIDSLDRYLSFQYNASGKIIQISDFRGGSCFYDYDGDDPIRFTDLEGNVYAYEYLKNEENPDNGHNLCKYILPNSDYLEIGYYKNDTVSFHRNKKGEVFNFQYSRLNGYAETWNEEGYYRKVFYNDNHDVTRVTTREKTVELKTYDSQHNITSFTDANGWTSNFTYDSRRNLTSKTNALSETWQYEYHPIFNKPVKIIDPENNQTQFEYDVCGNLIKITDALGNVTTSVYDSFGSLIKVTDAKGQTQENTYDSFGLNLIEVKDKNANRSTYRYDGVGNLIAETDPVNNTTTYEYNHYNQKTKITDCFDNVTKFEYDSNRFLTKLIEPNGAVTQNIYDTVRDMVTGAKIAKTIDPLGYEELYDYDKLGNLIAKSDKNENTTYFSYDEMNRLIETTDPFQNTLRSAYDGNGNLTSVTDKRGNTTTYTYDAANRKTSVIDPNENKTTFSYDKAGRLIRETNALAVVIRYEYDKLNRLIKKTMGDGLSNPRIFSFEYDEIGRLIKTTDPLGNYTVFEYDPNGNKIKEACFDTAAKKLSETSFFYDSRNLLVKKIDSNGNIWQYEYDKLKRKIAEIDPLENRIEYGYDKAGNLRAVKDQLENITAFTYNLRKEKITQTDALGNTKQFYYDPVGNLISVTDEQGNITLYSYDSLNRKIGETDSLGATTIFDYDENSNIIRKTDALNNSYRYEYDKNNLLVRKFDSLECGTIFQYDALNRLIKTFDSRGIPVFTEYDSFGQVIKITQAAGFSEEAIMQFEYDANGNKTKEINALAAVTTYEYDPRNLLIKKTLVGELGLEDIIYRYEYDAKGQLIKTIDPSGNASVFGYDKIGRKTTETTPSGNTTTLEYDKAGNLLCQTSPEGNKVSYEYDALGHRTKTISDGKEKTFAYDKKGRLTEETNFNGIVTNYEYDSLGHLKTKIEGTNTTDESKTNFNYDQNGNLKEIYLFKKINSVLTPVKIACFDYDQLNRCIAEYDAESSAKRFAYDGNGNITRITNRRGQVINKNYDNLNRLTEVKVSDRTEQVFAYDKLSRMTKAVDYNGTRVTNTVEFEYDCFNRVTAEVPNGKRVQKKYDLSSNPVKITYPSARVVEKTFTPDNLIQEVWYRNDKISSFQYNKDSQLNQASLGNGITQTIGYNNQGLESDRKYLSAGGAAIYAVTTEYDPDGNAIKENIFRNNEQIIRNYTYDNLNRITSGSGVYAAFFATVPADTWQYDEAGNWVSTTQNGRYNDINRRVNSDNEYDYIDPSQYIYYDAEGNLISYRNMPPGGSYNEKQYVYDWADRLIEVWWKIGYSVAPQKMLSYSYDALNRKSAQYRYYYVGGYETLSFLHDADQVVEEYVDGSLARSYVYGGYIDNPLLMESSSGKYYYLNDRQYNVVALADGNAAPVEYYQYNAFGLNRIFKPSDPLNISYTSFVGNPYSFTGRYYDVIAMLYYYRNRIYSPELGRFLQRDPQGYVDGINLYAYVRNNPLRYLDPMGWSARNIAQTSNNPEDPNNKLINQREISNIREITTNEVRIGDLGLQVAGTNKISKAGVRAGQEAGRQEPYLMHGVLVTGINYNPKDAIESLEVGEIRSRVQSGLLTNERSNKWLGEQISDYKFFRVTDEPEEARRAVYIATTIPELDRKLIKGTRLDISQDTKLLFDVLKNPTEAPKYNPNDSKMLCTEYLNFLYGNKFGNPDEVLVTPYVIYDYVKTKENNN